jgi:hypothetical protein
VVPLVLCFFFHIFFLCAITVDFNAHGDGSVSGGDPQRRLAHTSWTLPHLADRRISMKYNRKGEKGGEKRQRTAGVPEGIQVVCLLDTLRGFR